MRTRRSAALLALLAGAVVPALSAQAGRPYPVVLVLPASVRFAGLGGAGVPVIGDAGSVFVNPAGLAAVPHLGIEGAYDIEQEGMQPVGLGFEALGGEIRRRQSELRAAE